MLGLPSYIISSNTVHENMPKNSTQKIFFLYVIHAYINKILQLRYVFDDLMTDIYKLEPYVSIIEI